MASANRLKCSRTWRRAWPALAEVAEVAVRRNRSKVADSISTMAECTAADGKTAKLTATASAPDWKAKVNTPDRGITVSKSPESTRGLGKYDFLLAKQFLSAVLHFPVATIGQSDPSFQSDKPIYPHQMTIFPSRRPCPSSRKYQKCTCCLLSSSRSSRDGAQSSVIPSLGRVNIFHSGPFLDDQYRPPNLPTGSGQGSQSRSFSFSF